MVLTTLTPCQSLMMWKSRLSRATRAGRNGALQGQTPHAILPQWAYQRWFQLTSLSAKGAQLSWSGQLHSPIQLPMPSGRGVGTQEAWVLRESRDRILRNKGAEELQGMSSCLLNSGKLITTPSWILNDEITQMQFPTTWESINSSWLCKIKKSV